ncbi:MAG: hypothetical protein GF401_15265 [Chitinivibrionales bacterium]|nr:hypothetical protein [Chitinivibrionales bacterium]
MIAYLVMDNKLTNIPNEINSNLFATLKPYYTLLHNLKTNMVIPEVTAMLSVQDVDPDLQEYVPLDTLSTACSRSIRAI